MCTKWLKVNVKSSFLPDCPVTKSLLPLPSRQSASPLLTILPHPCAMFSLFASYRLSVCSLRLNVYTRSVPAGRRTKLEAKIIHKYDTVRIKHELNKTLARNANDKNTINCLALSQVERCFSMFRLRCLASSYT